MRSPARAVSLAGPGAVVCFAAGDYPPLRMDGAHGTAEAPIVLRAAPGAERRATLSSGSLHHGTAVAITRSEHVHVYDLRLTGSQKGIELRSVAWARVEGLQIEGLGQEAISVGALHTWDGTDRFLAPPAHHVDVIGNTIADTGRVTPRYGEGIYVGTGGFGGDGTHDTFIAFNTLERVRAEGVDLKAWTYGHIVRGNVIRDSSHSFHAAITVAVAPTGVPDIRCLIERNLISGYAGIGGPVAGIGVGHGDTVVRDNVIRDVQGAGIQTYTTFGNPDARRVLISGNLLQGTQGILLHRSDEGTGATDLPAAVTVTGNTVEP